MEEAVLELQRASQDLRRASRRLVVERRAGQEVADQMLSGVKERPKRKNFQPEATGQQASDFLASHPAKMSTRPGGSVAASTLAPSALAGCILSNMQRQRPSSCTLGRFPSEASMSVRRMGNTRLESKDVAREQASTRQESKDLRSHLEHCEQLLERVEAEVHERERQLAGICVDVSSKPTREVPYVSEMYETTSELSELRAELHERDKQLRGLQEEIGRAFNEMLPGLPEGASPFPVLPPPERSSLPSNAKVSLGDASQKLAAASTELPAPSLAASGDLSDAAIEQACLERLAAIISTHNPTSHDSHHIAPMSARLPGSRQQGSSRMLPTSMQQALWAQSGLPHETWKDLERLVYDVQVPKASEPATASSASTANGTSDTNRRRRLPCGPSSVEAPKASASSSQMFAAKAKEAYSRLNSSPPKPRGSYINAAGGQVYWLNYEEPMDLQRLSGKDLQRLPGNSISGGSAAAPSRPAREATSSRRAASAGCRGRILWDTGVNSNARSREELPTSDSEWSEEEPPSPSPEEPLLPETPQLATQRSTRPEVVPQLFGLADHNISRLSRVASAVMQPPPYLREDYAYTPRLPCPPAHGLQRLQRSGSVTGTAGLASCSSLRAPSTSATPRRQSSLVRRQLSAPRLIASSGVHTASHDCITPRSVSPGPKALGHHAAQQSSFVPKLHQLGKVAPSVQLRAEQPLSGRANASSASAGSQAIGGVLPQRCAAPPLMMPMFLSSTSPRCQPATTTSTSKSRSTDHRISTSEAGRTSPRPPCITTLPGPPRSLATLSPQVPGVNWGLLQQ